MRCTRHIFIVGVVSFLPAACARLDCLILNVSGDSPTARGAPRPCYLPTTDLCRLGFAVRSPDAVG